MSKLWICGICQNNAKELEEIFEPLDGLMFDHDNLGAVWVDGDSTDTTQFVLKSYGAQVVERKWTNDHDFQMNAYMRAGIIKHGDWIIQLDTSERLHPEFVQKLLSGMLTNFEEQGINTVYQRSKPILFRYHDDQIFSGSPHWGIVGQRRQMVDISKFDGFEDDKNYLWSNRDDINKWITNGIKYYYAYGRSNHMWLVYNPANHPGAPADLIQRHEQIRLSFREYCRNELRLVLDGSTSEIMACLDIYIGDGGEVMLYPKKFIEFLNNEKVIANYFRYLHGEDQQNIYDTQNTWKFQI